MNVELVAVAVMSVDLLQLGLVQGLVPGLIQVVDVLWKIVHHDLWEVKEI